MILQEAVSLNIPPFRPHPLVRGGHLQTILGSYLPHGIRLRARVLQVRLPDGDAIALHDDGLADESSVGLANSSPIVILLHGLGGSHQSSYMMRISAKLRARGVRVFRMDLRGCGAGLTLARHPLNAGRSEDAAAVLEFLHREYPEAPIHLVGFSMGANISLKLAGEFGATAPAHLASVMAVCPPIDLAECTRNIQRGVNSLYDRKFVNSLIKHIGQRSRLVPDAHTRPLLPKPRRLMDFDSLFTAPLCGYADVHDYYARASSGPLLSRIVVPTLILTAASDPIVPVACFQPGEYSATTQLHIAECGGHLGFIAAKSDDPDCRWLDWRVVEWIGRQTLGA